ncbi:HIT domain-containing protein [Candidatus Saccharibacteria bacterium]|nr:HIT domain-containing protein [Candidatus Saccharibacteria bacterium]
MPSIFSQIIKGEIPCYKIYEDDKTIAFLDIHPETKGHTLVIPKNETDKIYELPDEDYQALMQTVKKLSQHLEKQLNARILWKVIGTDVPHAHVHLMPLDPNWQHGHTLNLTPEEFEQIRTKLEFKQ